MTDNETPTRQGSLASLPCLQGPSDRGNNNGSKSSHKAAGSHSPSTTARGKGASTRSISSSLCVEMDHDGSSRGQRAEDKPRDVDSLLTPSDIDFLGIGDQFGDLTR